MQTLNLTKLMRLIFLLTSPFHSHFICLNKLYLPLKPGLSNYVKT